MCSESHRILHRNRPGVAEPVIRADLDLEPRFPEAGGFTLELR